MTEGPVHRVTVTRIGNVVVDGIRFKAAPTLHGDACTGCAFRADDYDVCATVPCDRSSRDNINFRFGNRPVIFVRVSDELRRH